MLFWRREVFETSVRENYLVNGMPSWYDAQTNLGLRMVNGNFVGLKYRVVKKKKIADKQLNQDPLISLAAELRTLHHIPVKSKFHFIVFKLLFIMYLISVILLHFVQ